MKKQLLDLYKKIYLLGGSASTRQTYLSDWENSLRDPRKYYLEATRFFYSSLPPELREHRKYFTKELRGFGEDAFHVMWFLLYSKYHFNSFLEIGVYRGQTISLLSLLAKRENRELTTYGVSPFSSIGDSVSDYLGTVDYLTDTQKNFRNFSLKEPTLVKAYSTDDIAKETISSRQWDCIYIDGSHDYEIVLKDWDLCSRHVPVGGLVVMDDASLHTDAELPFFAFKGHDGPSKVADAVDRSNFREVLRMGHNRAFQRIK